MLIETFIRCAITGVLFNCPNCHTNIVIREFPHYGYGYALEKADNNVVMTWWKCYICGGLLPHLNMIYDDTHEMPPIDNLQLYNRSGNLKACRSGVIP